MRGGRGEGEGLQESREGKLCLVYKINNQIKH